jgi:hypothetical protein
MGNQRCPRTKEIMNRITTTATIAINTSDRTFCFFRSLLRSSVNFGFSGKVSSRVIRQEPKPAEENAARRVVAILGLTRELTSKTSGIPQVRGTPDVGLHTDAGCGKRRDSTYFWATMTTGLRVALLASSFSTRVVGSSRPLSSPATQI